MMTEPSDFSAAKAPKFLNSCVVRPGDAGAMGVVCRTAVGSAEAVAVAVMAVLLLAARRAEKATPASGG